MADSSLFTSLPTKGRRRIEIPYYFCGVLVTSSLKHGGYNEKNKGFISLHSKYLKKIHPKYIQHLRVLVQLGVLQEDRIYVPGQKSKGYKFQQHYAGVDLRPVELNDYVLCKGIKKQQAEVRTAKIKSLKKYKHITKWFIDGKLKIDNQAALNWVDKQKRQEFIELLFSTKKKKKQRAKKLHDVWLSAKYFIEKLDSKQFAIDDFTTDEFGNRLHGMFTYQRSELRNFITYNGQQLTSIDIKNSQPYFTTLILDGDFWKSKENTNSRLKLSEINEELYRQIRQDKRICESIKWLDSSGSLTRQRFSAGAFKEDVVSGQLYEKFEQKLSQQLSDVFMEKYSHRVRGRRGVKQEVLRTLYCRNSMMHDNFHWPSRVFESSYPDVMRFFKVIKHEDHTLLARIIQQIESYCVLKLICGRIAEERPELPIFTIHDSIITTTGNEQYVSEVIRQVLNSKVGAPPQLKIEHWRKDNM